MIKSEPEVLDIILNHTNDLNKNRKLSVGKFGHNDFLPFSEIVPDIVNKMENHPIKPQPTFSSFDSE